MVAGGEVAKTITSFRENFWFALCELVRLSISNAPTAFVYLDIASFLLREEGRG